VKPLLNGLLALGPMRVALLAATGLLLLGSVLGLSFFAGTPAPAVLYSNLSLSDSAAAVAVLAADHINYTLGAGGQTIMVPASDLDSARLALAAKNLPSGGASSYALFDTSSALTDSDFMDNINETRALNGELEQTIEQIQGVRMARVNIVLPHQQPFAQNPDPAQASVLLTLDGPEVLDQTSVNAILNLVASAVPGLKPGNISIADDRGDLLAQAGGPMAAGGANAANTDLAKITGLQMSQAVESMLDDAIGPGHVHVVASVAMNFDAIDQTQTTYDPNGQVALSQQNASDKTTSASPTPSVSVQNNLPNPAPQSAASANSGDQQSQTTNYDVSTTVKHLVQNAPQISKLSVAVLLDGISTTDAKGKTSWAPRSASQISAITALVKSAVGFDASRGDVVEVETIPFAADGPVAAARPVAFLQRMIGGSNAMFLIKLAVVSIATLIGLMTVAKPVMMRIAAVPSLPGGGDPLRSLTVERARTIAASNNAQLTNQTDASAAGSSYAAGPSHEEIANIAANSPAGQIAALVRNNPKESIATIRSWLSQGQDA
jgi:flagellar M-ring protein FliF